MDYLGQLNELVRSTKAKNEQAYCFNLRVDVFVLYQEILDLDDVTSGLKKQIMQLPKQFWLVKTCHVTCNIEPECFISAWGS